MVDPNRPVESSTRAFLKTLTLDTAGEAKAQIAIALAVKLDQAVDSESAGVAQSVAGIAKQLSDAIGELSSQQSIAKNPVRQLFAIDEVAAG